MRQALKYEWLSRSEFYITIWMFVLAAVVMKVSKTVPNGRKDFCRRQKPSDALDWTTLSSEDRQTIDRVIRAISNGAQSPVGDL